ncbi:MAG TPA: hypothetical protein VF085_01120 [Solirubrobacterales bacterium]
MPRRHRPLPHPRRPLLPALAFLVVLAAWTSGCGSSDESEPTATATAQKAPPGATARGCGETTVAGTEGLRVTGIGCDVGRGIVAAWTNRPGCSLGQDASRSSCTVHGDYRCLAAATDRGIAVSCARPGGSAAFLARPS